MPRISIYFSEKDYSDLQKKADKTGLNLSNYIKDLCLKEKCNTQCITKSNTSDDLTAKMQKDIVSLYDEIEVIQTEIIELKDSLENIQRSY